MDDPLEILIGVLIGFLIGIIIASASVGNVRNQAIELGHAYYHPQTGDFTWNPACIPDTDKAMEGDGDD